MTHHHASLLGPLEWAIVCVQLLLGAAARLWLPPLPLMEVALVILLCGLAYACFLAIPRDFDAALLAVIWMIFLGLGAVVVVSPILLGYYGASVLLET